MSDTNVSGHLPVTEFSGDPSALLPQASVQQAKQSAAGAAAEAKAAALADYQNAVDSGFFDDCIGTWQRGATLSGEDMAEFNDLANKVSPAEIQSLAAQGVISRDDASALIMEQGLCTALPDPKTLDDIENGMINYYRLSDLDKSFADGEMRDAAQTENLADAGIEGELSASASSAVQAQATESQQKIASFLCSRGPEDAVGGLAEISVQETDGSDDVIAAFSRMDGVQDLNEGLRLKTLAFASLLARPVDASDADTAAEASEMTEDEQLREATSNMSIASLFFMVLLKNVDSMTSVLTNEKKMYQIQQDEYADCTECTAKLTAAIGDDDTNLEDVYFEDHDGNQVSVLDFCEMKDITLPDTLTDDDKLYLEYINDPDGIPEPHQETKHYNIFNKKFWTHKHAHSDNGSPIYKNETGYFGDDKIANDVLNMSDDERAAKKASLAEKSHTFDANDCQQVATNLSGWASNQKTSASMTESDMDRDSGLYQTFVSQDNSMQSSVAQMFVSIAKNAAI